MGSAQSTPGEDIYNAAASNKPQELAKLVSSLRHGPHYDSRVLEWRDKYGRTPLQECARKNRTACALVLLQAGADVHYVNNAPDSMGSALHEAAHKGADEMVALLLQHGASPWVANTSGHTALDEAVLSGAGAPVWRFKQAALHFSSALVKVQRLGGLSNPYKERHLLIIPYIPCPQDGHPGTLPSRKQLWFLSDSKAIVPKVRVWLCGATLLLGSRETILRLHPTHEHPGGNLHTRFDNGFCISMRPLNTLPSTLASFQQLLAACCPSCMPLVGPGVAAAAAPLSAGNPAAHSNSPARPAPPPLRPAQSVPPRPSVSAGSNGYLFSDTHARELGCNPSQGMDAAPDLMQAFPGESDSAFASRLAAMLSVEAPPDASPPAGNLVTTSHGSVPGAGSPFSSLPSMPQSHNSSPAPNYDHQGLRARETWHHGQGHPSSEHCGLLGGADSAPAGPGPLALQPTLSDDGPSSLVGGIPPEPHSPPSAPPLAASSAPSQDSTSCERHENDALPEEGQCIICLSAPRECGFLHGASMHLCVCRDCKKGTPPGSACPLCRQTVERVIDVF